MFNNEKKKSSLFNIEILNLSVSILNKTRVIIIHVTMEWILIWPGILGNRKTQGHLHLLKIVLHTWVKSKVKILAEILMTK